VDRRQLGTSLYVGLLFTVLGAVVWLSGQPFIFPSLAPSTFVLAFGRRGERTETDRVVDSHLISGVVSVALSSWG
jgi:hypothetical protein